MVFEHGLGTTDVLVQVMRKGSVYTVALSSPSDSIAPKTTVQVFTVSLNFSLRGAIARWLVPLIGVKWL